MRRLFFLLMCLPSVISGQAVDTLQGEVLPEATIYAGRAASSRTAVAQQVTVLSRQSIEQLSPQNTADLLTNTGTVFVQKSQQGGGSPVLRGFEASRVLLVVDGVRLNNAIYRSGHLQNVLGIDNMALERVEVLFGPATTLYGSDALGGALCFFTKDPVMASGKDRINVGVKGLARFGTVNREKTAHVSFNIAGQKIGAYTALTFSDFGDLRMGRNTGRKGAFGERFYYAQRIGGRDSLVKNANSDVQRFSGYRQFDALQKWMWKPSARQQHILNLQYSTTTNVPRYDRLTDPGTNGRGLRFAEWYYGPQERLLAAYKSVRKLGRVFDTWRTNLSYQDIRESRHTRRFGRNDLQNRRERVQVVGFETEAERNWDNHRLLTGVDAQWNRVFSNANVENIATGAISALDTRYPDGGSTMYSVAGFVTHAWSAARDPRWLFSEGIRLGYSGLHAVFNNKDFFPFPFSEVDQRYPIASGSVSAIFNPSSRWRLALNAANGFRVPNVDDLGKVFDSAPGVLIVPNPNARAEQTYNLDLNATYQIGTRLRIEAGVWGTLFRNALVTAPATFNGLDSLLYNGVKSRVLSLQNQRRARLLGAHINAEAKWGRQLTAYGSIAYTQGHILSAEAPGPLDHIPPAYGRLGIRWQNARLQAEGFALFNGRKPLSDYFLNGEDNEQYARPEGTLAWTTLHLRASWRLIRSVSLQIGADNLLDIQYRAFASGINGPGRNFFVCLAIR